MKEFLLAFVFLAVIFAATMQQFAPEALAQIMRVLGL
jgi:hypothetical protein